jgi:hypothetical protein
MKPRNAAPINLDKCHRPFGQLSDVIPPGYRSNTNPPDMKADEPGIAARILKSD